MDMQKTNLHGSDFRCNKTDTIEKSVYDIEVITFIGL